MRLREVAARRVTAIAVCAVAAAVIASVVAGVPERALASAGSADRLTYEPYGLVHLLHSSPEVDGYLGDLDAYGVGQALLQTPRLKRTGTRRLPPHDRTMITRWARRAVLYNADHGTDIAVTAVFNGQVRSKPTGGLNLDNATTRANLVASVESILPTGVTGVHLDLEPLTMSPGYLTLLEELDAMFARVGFTGRLSVVSSGNTSNWSPSYLNQVSHLVDQIDPMYYDSSSRTPAAYEAWVVDSLHYYSANSAPSARIVPVLPSYSANRWHRPDVENIDTATTGLSSALAAGSRVNGAGIWWWWGFFYDERGRYDASADRAAWQTRTLGLPYSR